MNLATKLAVMVSGLMLTGALVSVAHADSSVTYKKMQNVGCAALVAKDYPADMSKDGGVLAGVSLDQFSKQCTERSQYFLHNSAPKQSDQHYGDVEKYEVGFIQSVCMAGVSPDLYKDQNDWTKNRIACIRTMLQTSDLASMKHLGDLAQNKAEGTANARRPSSETDMSRNALHFYEHQMNVVLFGLKQ